MIRTETITIEGAEYIRTYSDTGMTLRQNTGILYDSAIDAPGNGMTYTETGTPIPDAEISPEAALTMLEATL